MKKLWTNWLRFELDPDHNRIQEPDLHRIFAFQQDIWRSYGRISMKFYVSIVAGVCMIW